MTDEPAKPARYADAGVDIDAGNRLVNLIRPAVARTRRPGADGTVGGFGGLFDLVAAGLADPILVAATDGVGTKLKLAIETAHLDTIGIDLVAMCVNDLLAQGAEPLFFLDYFATAKLDPERAAAVVAGIAEGCRIAGAALIGGETAEMPGLYSGSDFDLAGFAVGAVERERLLPRKDIAPGDIVLGLASSGVHSNGYSLVRKLVADSKLSWQDEAPFEPGVSLGEALLTPTRIYVPAVLAALRQDYPIKALAHVTGGGITENLPRAIPAGMGAEINVGALPVPPSLEWLRGIGHIEKAEMLRTFNCGVGMAAVVPSDAAEQVAASLTDLGESVTAIGRVTTTSGPPVDFLGEL